MIGFLVEAFGLAGVPESLCEWGLGGHPGDTGATCKWQQQVVLRVFGVLRAFSRALEMLTYITLLMLGSESYLCESPGERTFYLELEDWGLELCLCHLVPLTRIKLSRSELLICPVEMTPALLIWLKVFNLHNVSEVLCNVYKGHVRVFLF